VRKNHFLTTPLPHHGPSGSYGYTTTTSFVNVQFGGSYPVTSHLSTQAPPALSDHQPDHHQHQWSEISKYHLLAHRTNDPALEKNSHIKQSTAGPVLLPPLTPTLRKNNIHNIFVKKPSISFTEDTARRVVATSARPVTLPPFTRNKAPHQPLAVRDLTYHTDITDLYQKKINRRISFPSVEEEPVGNAGFELPHTTSSNGLPGWRENYRAQPALEFVDSDSWQTEPVRRKFSTAELRPGAEAKQIRFPLQ